MAIVRCRVVADMKAKQAEYRAVLDNPNASTSPELVSPNLSSSLPSRSYDEELREQIRDIEYHAGWTQRNCNQFFTGLLLSSRNPQSAALAKKEVTKELGLSRECLFVMRDCFIKSPEVFQVMKSHVLNRVTVPMRTIQLGLSL